MLPCHINAFLIRPGRVLGRKLRPLTLAHYWILEAVDSPYVWGITPKYSDMVFAVFTLSVPAWFSRWLLMRPAVSRAVFKAWGMTCRRSDESEAMRSFAAYWQAYTDMPAKWTKDGQKTNASCLPASVNIAWAIMGKVGEHRVWSMPMPLALSYLVAESEYNGGEYKTERDAAMTNKGG
jgi:hypothetical protein